MPHCRATATLLAAALTTCPLLGVGFSVHAQDAARIDAAPLHGEPAPVPPLLPADHPFAEAILRADTRLSARQAKVFEDSGGKVLLLEGDVRISVGIYAFTAKRAVVRVDTPSRPGKPVRYLSMVLEEAQPLGGTSAIRASGDRLLVTAAARGDLELKVDSLQPVDAPPDDEIVADARRRIVDYREKLAMPMRALPPINLTTDEQDALRQARRKQIASQRREIQIPDPQNIDDLVDAELVDKPVLPTRGVVRYQFDRGIYQIGEQEDAVMLIGNVRIVYEDYDEGRDFALSAEKVVIFLSQDDQAPGTVPQQVDAGRIRGVYLEDNAIITDGKTTVRAPRAFYDLGQNRAVLLDAVVYSFDIQRQIPLYMRAEVIRQTSAEAFVAKNAVFTTSEFANPHIALGADRLELTQRESRQGVIERRVTASGVTVEAEGTPLFYWPYLETPADAVPIRRVRAGYDRNDGPQFETAWDVFALAGTQAPEDVELLANIDWRGEHGVGLGLDLEYNRPDMRGNTRGYFLPNDSGEDNIADRDDVTFNDDTRGFFQLQHRQQLPSDWELSLEGSYVSDPTFLEAFFESEAYAAKPYETSAYLKKAEDDWALTALLKYDTNNFTPQLPTLLTPGYTVDKLPEIAYFRNGTSVFGNRATWYSESRIGQVRARFGDDSPADRGFTNAQSLATFGITNTTSFYDAAVASGFPTNTVGRVDTRNELAIPLRAGAVDITPYVVGRVTAYDDDFNQFRGEDDQIRFWGGTGVDLSTEFTKTLGDASNQLLDLDGLRHIVQPHATFAIYGASLESEDLPVYDPEIESLAEGGVVRLGVTNTLQTKRGRGLQQRTVDWLSVRTDVVLRSDDADTDTPIARYFDHRPEYSMGGDHFYGELLWAVTEATAVTGELTHSFETGEAVQWRIGLENQHDDHLTTFVNYREINPIDARLLTYGATLQISTKYRLGASHVIDFEENRSRAFNVALERRIPRASLQFVFTYDELDNNTALGVVFTPDGFSRGSGILGR